MKIGVDYIGISTPFYCHDGQGSFLLHKRSQNCRDNQGYWDVGGGKLEFGMNFKDNVLKEVFEEYGVAGEIDEQLPAYELFREADGIRTHGIAIPFIVRINREEAKINEPEKMDELGWFKLDKLPEPLHPGIILALERCKDYFARYRFLSSTHFLDNLSHRDCLVVNE